MAYRKSGGVLTFEEMRSDRIAVAYLLTRLHDQKANIIGINGMPFPELLSRLVQINYEIEGMLAPYIEDPEYWSRVATLKEGFRPEILKMQPRLMEVREKLAEWDRLLSQEELRMNLLFTRHSNARV